MPRVPRQDHRLPASALERECLTRYHQERAGVVSCSDTGRWPVLTDIYMPRLCGRQSLLIRLPFVGVAATRRELSPAVGCEPDQQRQGPKRPTANVCDPGSAFTQEPRIILPGLDGRGEEKKNGVENVQRFTVVLADCRPTSPVDRESFHR